MKAQLEARRFTMFGILSGVSRTQVCFRSIFGLSLETNECQESNAFRTLQTPRYRANPLEQESDVIRQ